MSGRTQPYHHGDLRAALLDAALDATRTGGPGALSLRDVTRTVGVSPAAAYRHFSDRAHLVSAVALEVQSRMAATMRRWARAPRSASETERALVRLRGVGLGYIAFAIAEPGWFATAFFGDGSTRPAEQLEEATPPPFVLLTEALDALVEAGALPPERRPGAEFACWSAVHGCAQLLTHGPLRDADDDLREEVTRRTVDDIIAGVCGPGRPDAR